MKLPRITRRKFIFAGAAAAAGGGFALLRGLLKEGGFGEMTGLPGNAPEIKALASEYLARYPNEGNEDYLAKALGVDGKIVTDALAFRERIRKGILDDIKAGELVSVGGWQLTRTEARLLVAASL